MQTDSGVSVLYEKIALIYRLARIQQQLSDVAEETKRLLLISPGQRIERSLPGPSTRVG